MITFTRWKEIGQFFANIFPMAETFIYGASDEDILAKVEKLQTHQFPVLIGILPTITGQGSNRDDWGHQSPLFYYCMVPVKDRTESETDQAWETTLWGVSEIEKAIKENQDPGENRDWPELYDIKVDTVHIDPEYRLWGLMGWSIGFDMTHST